MAGDHMKFNLWNKVRPLKIGNKFIVPKTYCDVYDEERNYLLPYSVMKASPAIDIWAFGVLLFTLVSGSGLMFVNRDDDVPDEVNDHPATLTDDKIYRKILSSIPLTLGTDASLVRALLAKCLKVNPKERIFSMDEIMDDPFFTGSHTDVQQLLSQQSEMMKTLQRIDKTTQRIEEKTVQIEDISVRLRTQLMKTETLLLRGIFEASEVKIPSCFIIVNQKLAANCSRDNTDMEKLRQWLNKLGWLGNVIDSAVETTTNRASEIHKALKSLWIDEELWLYLIDERTMKPVIPVDDSIYPIKITTPKEWIPKLAPLLKVSLKAVRTLNTVSGFAKCLGFHIPGLSSETFRSIESAVGQISKKSSVEEYELLHEVVMKSESSTHGTPSNSSKSSNQAPGRKNVRGEALREFERFLTDHDPHWKFAGLKRVCTSEGFACWTTEEGTEEIRKEAKGEEETDYSKVELSVSEKEEEHSLLSFRSPALGLLPHPTAPAGNFPGNIREEISTDSKFTLASSVLAPTVPHQGSFEQRIRSFYEKYNKNRILDIPSILEKYKGKEQELIEKLKKQYKVLDI
jgi:serine/threonine protein kinase